MTKPEEDDALAAYQEALASWMAEPELTAEEIARRLAVDIRAAPFGAYVASFDLRCIEVTSRLMRLWGTRQPSPPEADRPAKAG